MGHMRDKANARNRIYHLFTALLLTASLALVATPAVADHHKSAEKAFDTLQRIEVNALDIREQAGRLQTFVRFPGQYSWEVHADQLNRIRSESDDIGDLMKSFEKMRKQATQRQNQAFTEAYVHAGKLADAAEKATRLLSQNKVRMDAPPPEYVSAIETIYRKADAIIAELEQAETWWELKEDMTSSD